MLRNCTDIFRIKALSPPYTFIKCMGVFALEEVKNTAVHKVMMHNRSDAILTGVLDVISFDEAEVRMETTQGTLTIKGKELHVKRLTLEKGEVELDGTIDSFVYSHSGAYSRKGESVIKRLFK